MKYKIPQNKQQWLAVVLWAVAAVLGVLSVRGVLGYVIFGRLSPQAVEAALAQSQTDPGRLAAALEDSKKRIEELRKNSLFMPPPPPPQPPKEVSGILGDRVLFNGKWYKVGEEMGGAKVLAIEATHVKIEWEGKEITLAPIKAADAPAPVRAQPDTAGKKPAAEIAAVPSGAQTAPEVVPAAADDDLAWLDIPAALKDKFRPLWNQMSDEQKKQAKERWDSMTDQQKEDAIQQMSSRL